jgi:mono/diheme cytochrome c family protein
MNSRANQPVKAAGTRCAGLLAEFASPQALLAAAARAREAGFTRWDAYTPYPVAGLEEMTGPRRGGLGRIAFVAGALGALAGLAVQWLTNAWDYPWNVSGKPDFSVPAWIPVIFQFAILFSAVGAFLGWMVRTGLPRFRHHAVASGRFARATSDGFFLLLESADPVFCEPRAEEALREAGALAVERIEEGRSEARLPRGLVLGVAALGALCLVPPALLALRRVSTSGLPRPRLFAEMDHQPKHLPDSRSAFFADQRAMRRGVFGTVARGALEADDALYRGKVQGQWVTRIPMPLDRALMERGQERFKLFCAMCHGLGGAGDGMVSRRAESLKEGTWAAPAVLYSEPLSRQPVGRLFETITNGLRQMPAHGPFIQTEDRWAIVLYLRALQRRQNGRLEDVPEELRP